MTAVKQVTGPNPQISVTLILSDTRVAHRPALNGNGPNWPSRAEKGRAGPGQGGSTAWVESTVRRSPGAGRTIRPAPPPHLGAVQIDPCVSQHVIVASVVTPAGRLASEISSEARKGALLVTNVCTRHPDATWPGLREPGSPRSRQAQSQGTTRSLCSRP